MPSRLARQDFTKHFDEADRYYVNVTLPKEPYFHDEAHWKNIAKQNIPVVEELCSKVDITGTVLEIGTASGWLTAELSKRSAVKEIFALDASEAILKKVTPKIFSYLKADEDKITRVIGDFHALAFDNKTFDVIIFNALLTQLPENSYHLVLKEMRRTLKDDGIIIGLHEPLATPFPLLKSWHARHYKTKNPIRTTNEWRHRFHKAKLSLRISPHKRLLSKVRLTPLEWIYAIIFPSEYFITSMKQDE